MNYSNSAFVDPDRGFRVWLRSDLKAATGLGQWVPNVNDLVVDYAQGYLRVVAVDLNTGYSTLKNWSPVVGNVNNSDGQLVTSPPGTISETYRMFVNTRVTPHTMAPDSRIRSYRSTAAFYRVFLGTDVNENTGTVISLMYDGSGNFLGNEIPMVDVAVPEARLSTAKACGQGFTVENLPDGEVVTIVTYAPDGSPEARHECLISNTAAVMAADSSKRYINNIAIISPFISSGDRQVIEFPLNATVESIPMVGRVYYSDNTTWDGPLDGSRFSLLGLENYIASETGQEFPLVLSYALQTNEVSSNITPSPTRTLDVDYVARTVAPVGAFSSKLFVFPEWVNAAQGYYRLVFWLYNMDRQLWFNATPYVELGVNSDVFNPTLYGSIQTMTYVVNLNNVDGRLPNIRHVQTVQVALLNSGATQNANWEVYFTPNQPDGYGRGLFADCQFVSLNFWRLSLANGALTKAAWLDKMYYSTQPLFNPDAGETRAPEPTHFELVFLNNTYRFPVANWSQVMTVNNDLTDGQLLNIRWIRVVANQDLQLGISAVPMRTR